MVSHIRAAIQQLGPKGVEAQTNLLFPTSVVVAKYSTFSSFDIAFHTFSRELSFVVSAYFAQTRKRKNKGDSRILADVEEFCTDEEEDVVSHDGKEDFVATVVGRFIVCPVNLRGNHVGHL